MAEYTLYVDVLLVRLACNFIFEYLLLWATSSITLTQTRPLRLSTGAMLGTVHYALYLLSKAQIIPFYGFIQFFPVVLLVSIAMLYLALRPKNFVQLRKIAGYFYLIGFIAAGAGMASAYAFSGPKGPRFFLGIFISSMTILLVAELGWGVVHERMIKRIHQIPIEINCNQSCIKIQALLDTGNSLKDPLNKQPVIIVEQQALQELLPSKLEEIIADLEQGSLTSLNQADELEGWETRIRLIPFSSIGKPKGLLLGFRPDQVKIAGQRLPENLHPTIAIHPHRLDPTESYFALIPPQLVQNSEGIIHFDSQEGGASHVQG